MVGVYLVFQNDRKNDPDVTVMEAGIPDARSFRIPASPSAVVTGIKSK